MHVGMYYKRNKIEKKTNRLIIEKINLHCRQTFRHDTYIIALLKITLISLIKHIYPTAHENAESR